MLDEKNLLLHRKVEETRLYHHIIELLGPNDPVFTPASLDRAADYLSSELESYGLEVIEQEFKLDGNSYRNIEGVIDTGEKPELLLTAHYDTVPQAPGANDNLSGVSVMLEAARILSKVDDPINVRVIGFTLEEGYLVYRKLLASAQKLGLMDENFNFVSLETWRLQRKFISYVWGGRYQGREYKPSVDLFMTEFRNQMNENEMAFFENLGEYFSGLSFDSWIGDMILVGSSFWVKNRPGNLEIAGVINYDTIGYTSQKPNSQSLPPGVSQDMTDYHLVDDPSVGNYVLGLGDINSKDLLDSFTGSCLMDGVELPFHSLHVPMGYEAINEKMFDLLRLDSAPFWKEGIPAITLTDTGKFRHPFIHTAGDTIDKLDFEFIAKICKASIATVVNRS